MTLEGIIASIIENIVHFLVTLVLVRYLLMRDVVRKKDEEIQA